ncbi:hypothetical protein OH77DRAFT_469996 [Trametes cingulata]|nr:hypothetical protein OH77DRAFT_469996 [Trametes cingulata]
MASFGFPYLPETPSLGSRDPPSLCRENDEPPHPTESAGNQPDPYRNLPLCGSCLSAIHALLAHSQVGEPFPSETAERTSLADYTVIPALVHRSQLSRSYAGVHGIPSGTPPTISSAPLRRNAALEGQTALSSPCGAVQRNARGVTVACTNCRHAGKRCDEARPCTRCINSRLEGSCVNPPPRPRRRRGAQPTTHPDAPPRVAGRPAQPSQVFSPEAIGSILPVYGTGVVPDVSVCHPAHASGDTSAIAEHNDTYALQEGLPPTAHGNGEIAAAETRQDATFADSSWATPPPWPQITDNPSLLPWDAEGLTADCIPVTLSGWYHHVEDSFYG